jgi:folate-binding protein YgfZ
MERRAIFGGEAPPAVVARTAADTRRGAPAVNAWARPAQASDCESWRAGRSLPLLTQHLLTTLRVEAGIASFGIDFDDTRFPQETGAEADAVSYTKGCYLGQEVIARLHYRGQAQNVLRGLRFEGTTPEPGTAVLHDGREAGRATSVADSPRFGPIGLAILHRRAEPGSAIELLGGGQAEVVELPFV